MASPILSVKTIRKRYGRIVAVDGVSFDVLEKEIVGLLGPNGAGKTTVINTILGVLKPDDGSVHIDGLDVTIQRSRVLERSNFAAVYAPLPGNLTVAQNMRVFGMLYGVSHLAEKIEDLLKRFDIDRFRNTRCGVLSSGEQTRVGLAKAMLNNPRLLLLDEPTASLDPAVAKDVRAQIRAYASQSGGGVLLTSHNMTEVEEICDRVLFISHGKILLGGNPKTLPLAHGKKSLEDLFVAVAREPLRIAEN